LGTDICHPRICTNVVPSAFPIEIPTPGVDPPKNFAISAWVPVGAFLGPCGATVTVRRAERKTSPAAPDSLVQPVASGLAEIP
jgi:hypothetical protein